MHPVKSRYEMHQHEIKTSRGDKKEWKCNMEANFITCFF
jgi:hypothetical protein